MKTILRSIILSILFVTISFANTINVPADIDSIQGGINMAVDGDTVLVQPGTYVENINIVGKKIVVGSLFLNTHNNSYISNTIIDGSNAIFNGDILGLSVVTFIDSVDSTTVLCGITITNGKGGYYCGGPGCAFYGGGISCYNSNPTLSNLRITGNSGYAGGGMLLQNSNPKLTDVTIDYNSAYIGGGIHFGVVGWNWNSISKPKFDSTNRCNIHSNYATRGSDLYLDNDTLSIQVIVDTFTVMHPTNFHTYPEENFNFDILTSKIEQSNSDLYVSPNGNNSNTGLTINNPLKSISYAMMKITADSSNPHSIYLANGEYFDDVIKNSPIGLPDYVSMIGESPSGVIFNAENFFWEVFHFNSSKSVAIENLTIIGGRILSENSDLIIKNAILKGTSLQLDESNAQIENVIIIDIKQNNSAIRLFGSNATLVNVEATDNCFESSGTYVLAMQYESYVNMINCTISNNKNSYNSNGGIYLDNNSFINIINSIIWNNTPTNIAGDGVVRAFYSDIQGGWLGEGNIDAYPLFIDTTIGDYRLQAGSSCIDAGTAFFEFGGDTLINLNPWQYNGSAPDMGAYEFGPPLGISEDRNVPKVYTLKQNYPNPFNPNTTIEFSIPKSETVTLKIYNLLGQEVEELVAKRLSPGEYKYIWNASGFASGIYYYKLEAGSFVQTRKLIFLK